MEKELSSGEQQSINTDLACRAKAGDSAALDQLWERNGRFIHSRIWQLYAGKENLLKQHGLTMDDLENEMFFALADAVKKFDPEKSSFLTYLTWYIRRQFMLALQGEHGRIIATEDGRTLRVSANPLNGAACLDEPVPGFEDDAITRLDLVEDPDSEKGFEEVDDALRNAQIKETVWAALDKLPEHSRRVIIDRYLSDERKTYAQIGEELGVSFMRARQFNDAAVRKLRNDGRLRKLYREEIGAKAYQHTSFGAWANGSGSVEEWIIERQERQEEALAKRRAEQEQWRNDFRKQFAMQ